MAKFPPKANALNPQSFAAPKPMPKPVKSPPKGKFGK